MLRWRYLAVLGLSVISSAAFAVEPATSPSAQIAATEPTEAGSAESSDVSKAQPQDAVAPAPNVSGETAAPLSAPEAPAATAPAAAQAPTVAVEPPLPPSMTVSIDLAQQTMVVSENGEVRYSWPISSGTSQFPTPRGTFRPQWTAKMWYSRKYDMAPMPHAVFINGGVAVHGTQHISALGNPASHGCIRLAPGNARTFYNLVQRHGLKRVKVAVHGTPKWRAPAIASRKAKPAPSYYASEQSGFWSWTNGSYGGTSAYDAGFVQKKYRKVQRPNGPQVGKVYRGPNGQKYVYVQRRASQGYYTNY